MENDFKVNDIDEADKAKLISRLIDELPVLRTKLGLSQDELCIFEIRRTFIV